MYIISAIGNNLENVAQDSVPHVNETDAHIRELDFS